MFINKKTVPSGDLSSNTKDPLERKRSINRIINETTEFDIIESYKAARTNIMFSLNSEKGCKKVVITSATSGEGKSTFCINIAKTFAQTGARVLIIDADLRAPRVHKYLKLDNEKGLSNVLAGFDGLDVCISRTPDENLDCITSGAIPPNPVELLSSDEMTATLEKLSESYDYIFLDTPPVNIVTEALLLSKMATGVVLVARQKYTMYKVLERAVNALKFAEAKILGVILNDADDKYIYGGYRSEGGYRYRSRKRGRYGSRYGYYGSYRQSAEEFRKKKESEDKTKDEQNGKKETSDKKEKTDQKK